MKDLSEPDQRRTYDAAFRAEALRLTRESHSIQVAARAGYDYSTTSFGVQAERPGQGQAGRPGAVGPASDNLHLWDRGLKIQGVAHPFASGGLILPGNGGMHQPSGPRDGSDKSLLIGPLLLLRMFAL